MSELQSIARLKIHDGQLGSFQEYGGHNGAILQTCSASGEICGTPGPELIEMLKDSPVRVYTPFLANEVTRVIDRPILYQA